MNMQKLGEYFETKLKTLKTALRTSIVLGKMAALCLKPLLNLDLVENKEKEINL
jgi:hypothetical protein